MGACFSGFRPTTIHSGAMDSHASHNEPMDVAMEPVGLSGVSARLPLPPVVIPTNIFYGIGFVIHGLGFQFSNDTRTGLVLEDTQDPIDLHDSYRMPHRADHSMNLQYGEFPTGFIGFSSHMRFLAFQIEFTTTKDQLPYRTLPVIAGTEVPQRGDRFDFQAPAGYYIKDIWWASGRPTQVYLAVIPSLVPGYVTTFPHLGWTTIPTGAQ